LADTGTNATDPTISVTTAGAAATKEVFTATFAATWATGDTAVFDGTTITLGATQTPNAMAVLVAAGTYTNWDTSISGDVVTFTQKVAATLTDIDSSTFVITTAGDGTGAVSTTTQYAAAVAEVTSVTFGALTSGETVIINGITVTAPSGGLTGAEVAAIYAGETDIVSGSMSATYASGAQATGVVTFTAGAVGTQTDLANTGTGTVAVSVTTQGATGNYLEVLSAAASVDAFLTAAGTALDGTVDYYFGVVGSDGYLATDLDGTNVTNVIKLAGVTDIEPASIVV